MIFSAILSESWRNLATGTSRALASATVLIITALIMSGFDLASILALQQESDEWISSGAAIHIISGDRQISPVTCTNLAHTTGTQSDGTIIQPIQASGAIKKDETITLNAMPNAPLDAWQATPSLAEVLGIGQSQQAHSGVWISSQLAQTLYVHEGDVLDTTQGPMHISAIFPWPDDSRDQRIAYAIIIPTPAGSDEVWDECWSTIFPSSTSAEDLLSTTAITTLSAMPATQTKQANTALGTNADFSYQYHHRSTRIMLVTIPIVSFIIALAIIRTRKIEIADDLHMGIPRSGLYLTTALETLAWSLPSILVITASMYLSIAVVSSKDNANTLTMVQLPFLIVCLITAQLGTITGITSIQGTKLFKFFKRRQ
ncbi:hypothetical protein [Bifidobacterium oedipodis]|uniref:ABC transporter permease n=1 Tax=Bifidobacterium oedipodis TaxID=2675322 RepID=A0A7Y0ER23_9BIFI|nr:hypothetical protein [Bifidobacterium sp. DSM 109957]NMM93761.1 hypothetical protein [Bifidobacterium sp. DSM 109957]